MKKLHVMKQVLKRTRVERPLLCFLVFFLVIAAVLWLVEPGMNTYRDAIWYCCAVVFTTGFGDFVATTFLGKLCSILLSCYAIFALAILTGVVVTYYNQAIQIQYEDTKLHFLDQLERLPELSQEELKQLAEKAKKLR
ncbi:MAG: potassium channel family protein [Clostridiales bacterium]|uniref:potassium channel family protein n=1 Tax=Evtepia sp. TaxID=2773933 RepID=UPI0029874437|nr:potassium channel family protein [Evtepia sp.]MDD7288198.1 potassium channel family protein [Clostridiales bacterium]MDY4431458.1 potassium channel family protein [Evtepia sp.]